MISHDTDITLQKKTKSNQKCAGFKRCGIVNGYGEHHLMSSPNSQLKVDSARPLARPAGCSLSLPRPPAEG